MVLKKTRVARSAASSRQTEAQARGATSANRGLIGLALIALLFGESGIVFCAIRVT